MSTCIAACGNDTVQLTETTPTVTVEPTEPVATLPTEPAAPSVEQLFLEAYFNDVPPENASIEFYGIYDGAYVGIVRAGMFGSAVLSEEIGGLIFTYYNGLKLQAYKDGQVLPLKDAYESGWFTLEAFGQLYGAYSKVHPPQIPQLGMPLDDPALEQEIVAAMGRLYNWDDSTVSQVKLGFCGNYGGTYAVVAWNYPWTVGMKEYHYVAGRLFAYRNNNFLHLHKDGQVLELRDAWTQGWLTEEYLDILQSVCAGMDSQLYGNAPSGYLLRLQEKKICTATLDDTFVDNMVHVMVYTPWNTYEYTPEDFAEIGCISVRESFSPKQDESPSRILTLELKAHSLQNVLDAIRMLEQREDVYLAEPNYLMSID